MTKFYRRIWFWVLLAPALLVAAVFASLILGVWGWGQGGSTTVTFTRVTETPDGPIYNMTEGEAEGLPGNLREALHRAAQVGSATATFSSDHDYERALQAINHSKYVRYQGVVLERGLAMRRA